MSTTRAAAGLVAILVVTAAAPVIGGWATASGVDSEWFRALRTPGWNPPGWVFGPVWTLLYALMALAAWVVWKRLAGAEGSATLTRAMALPLGLYGVQLALNVAWSVIFFAMREVGWAFVELVMLWVMIVATTIAFARVSTAAAWLMSPYLLWVSFAGVLNLVIWRMNTSRQTEESPVDTGVLIALVAGVGLIFGVAIWVALRKGGKGVGRG